MLIEKFVKRVAKFAIYADYNSPPNCVNANLTSFIAVTC